MLRQRSAIVGSFMRIRGYATVSNPQTRIEKIVQKYAVDLSPSTKVKAGDYVMIRPEHVWVLIPVIFFIQD